MAADAELRRRHPDRSIEPLRAESVTPGRERAAEITSVQVEPGDPDAVPVPAWQTELEARQRETVRHEPMPRVPHAQAVAAQAEARDFEPEIAD